MVDIPASKLSGQELVFPRVVREIDSHDGMRFDDVSYYFIAGANALSLILDSMSSANMKISKVSTILDYACGYGRVLRWLVAGFPQAEVMGIDADSKAALSAARVMSVKTATLDVSLQTPLGKTFDIIWVGSLFTHLMQPEFAKVLKYLSAHLKPEGILVFTTHGEVVVNRITRKQKTYNLNSSQLDDIIEQYNSAGYGFQPYSWSPNYGISISSVREVEKLIQHAGFATVLTRPAGWVNHQDAFACVHAQKRPVFATAVSTPSLD